jgi:hypothetical protein
MGALHREDVAVVRQAAIATADPGRGRNGEDRRCQREKEKSGGAPQWCSMTRSTMLYSFASSALMK